MITFKNLLLEKSFEEGDIPKYFFLLFTLDVSPEDTRGLHALEIQTFHEIHGISSSYRYSLDHLNGGRNTILIMDGKQTLQINKLSRFMYHNIEYFLSNNMKFLKRLLDFNTDDYEFMMEILRRDLQYYHGRQIAQEYEKQSAQGLKINNLKQLTTWVTNEYGKHREFTKVQLNDFASLLKQRIDTLITNLSSESEWVLKDNILHVPQDSELCIRFESEYDDDELSGLIEMRHLNRKYRIAPFFDVNTMHSYIIDNFSEFKTQHNDYL